MKDFLNCLISNEEIFYGIQHKKYLIYGGLYTQLVIKFPAEWKIISPIWVGVSKDTDEDKC